MRRRAEARSGHCKMMDEVLVSQPPCDLYIYIKVGCLYYNTQPLQEEYCHHLAHKVEATVATTLIE
jgi:hypothetical protein